MSFRLFVGSIPTIGLINLEIFEFICRLLVYILYMEVIKLECFNCKKEFDKSKNLYNNQIKNGRSKFFCSLNCSAVIQMKERIQKRKKNYELNPKVCKNCNSTIPYGFKNLKIFCSQSCSASFNNKNRITNRTSKNRKCQFCNAETVNKKYCSVSCFNKNLVSSKFSEIENGLYKTKNNKFLKKFLISKNGHQCQMCFLNEWGGKPILLILDHIDGDSENFNLKNLRLICSNCDTLTLTYKGKNKGNGRFSRRKRYQDGKSF